MKKILICDYDDTFYLNDEDIKINIQKVNTFRKEGNIFAFATGRSYYDFMKKSDKYNLEYDYLILNHGTTIIDSNTELSYSKYIDDKIIDDLKKLLHLENSIKNFCCTLDNSRASFNDRNIVKIYVKYNSSVNVEHIKTTIMNKYSNYINCIMLSNASIEIVNKEVSKVKAIDYIVKKMNIDNNCVYTIGDGYSDIDMIKKYNGYCMENSIDTLAEMNIKKYKSVSLLIDDILNNKI